jgi:hypothetical protein
MVPSCYVTRWSASTVANGRLVVDRAGGKARLVPDASLNKKEHGSTPMRTAPSAWRRVLCLGLAVSALSACGGGGGGDPPPSASSDAGATGLWEGLFTSSDGTKRGFGMLVAPDGRLAGTIDSTGSNGRLVLGTGNTMQNTFSATGTVFAGAGEALLPNGQASDPLTVSGGTVVAHVSLSGTFSGGGESGSFALTYLGTTSRGASLPAIAGVYTGYPLLAGNVATSSLVVNGNVVTFANDSGCNGAGTIEVIDASLNMYSWSMLIAACGGVADHTVSGLATLSDDQRGATGKRIELYGATAASELPFVFSGFK